MCDMAAECAVRMCQLRARTVRESMRSMLSRVQDLGLVLCVTEAFGMVSTVMVRFSVAFIVGKSIVTHVIRTHVIRQTGNL